MALCRCRCCIGDTLLVALVDGARTWAARRRAAVTYPSQPPGHPLVFADLLLKGWQRGVVAAAVRSHGARARAATAVTRHPRLLTRTETAIVAARVAPTLEAFVTYLVDQSLIAAPVPVDDLFVPTY